MAKAQDQELTKAFAELQQKIKDTRQKLNIADVQIDSLKRSKQHAELTGKEVTSLPPNTKTYESVGRMFILDDVVSIKEGLDKRIKSADEKIKTLESNKSFLERSLKENANNVREMVQQRQSTESSG